jgi:hypothetical protein
MGVRSCLDSFSVLVSTASGGAAPNRPLIPLQFSHPFHLKASIEKPGRPSPSSKSPSRRSRPRIRSMLKKSTRTWRLVNQEMRPLNFSVNGMKLSFPCKRESSIFTAFRIPAFAGMSAPGSIFQRSRNVISTAGRNLRFLSREDSFEMTECR